MKYSKTLDYFVGKVCTISTLEINFRFKEEQMMDYFMGIVEKVEEAGILIMHTVTKSRSFIGMDYVVCVAEEQVLYESDPEQAKIIEEYRKEKPITAPQRVVTPFVDPKAMAELAQKAKKTYTKP